MRGEHRWNRNRQRVPAGGRGAIRTGQVGAAMIRTVFWEDGSWYMFCGKDRIMVELTDSDDKPVGEPVEETQDDERTTDLRTV